MASLNKVHFRRKAFKLLFFALCLSISALFIACGANSVFLPDATAAPTSLDLSDSGLTDITSLLDQTQLETLDLRGDPISIEDYAALEAALPDCDIAWSVPVGGARYDSTSQSLALTAPSGELAGSLAFFPQLQEVRFDRATDRAAIDALTEKYPQVRFDWNVSFNGNVYSSETETLDLSDRQTGLDGLPSVLALLPELKTVTFGDETFSLADQLSLAEAFPDVTFVWNVGLLENLTVRSDVTELDLRDYEVTDAAGFSKTLRLLPELTYLDMCGCGPSDAEMAAMRAEYPKIQFVWYTRVAGWRLRTDIVGFSTGNRSRFPNGAGKYVAEEFSYESIAEEDLENLKYCTDLIALDIGHCGHVKSLDFLAELPKLKYLDIALCDFTDISALESQPDLVYLQMMYNCVEDISPLTNCKDLRFLNLSDNKISDYRPLLELTKLERLWINSVGITDEDIAVIEGALPDTLIKACQTDPEFAISLWCKGNEGYVTVQELYGLRAKFQ